MTQSRFPEMAWYDVIDLVSRCVYRVYSGDVAGTCFLVSLAYSQDK